MPSLSVKISKRLLDVVASGAGLALTVPIYPVIALAIRLDSPGPVLFKQERASAVVPPDAQPGVPLRCETFTLYKFRTMRVDAERNTGAVLAGENDPRVTRVGRFLRKSRLDELPQLWNVLRGEMSLVGPRPERPELLLDLCMAIPFFEERVRDVKPGVTGPAQVHLGYTGAIPEGSDLWALRDSLQNPFGLEEAEGALADDMRAKLLYDLAYCASLERLSSYLRMEAMVLLKTPLVMLEKIGR